jgi:hypothetical protein
MAVTIACLSVSAVLLLLVRSRHRRKQEAIASVETEEYHDQVFVWKRKRESSNLKAQSSIIEGADMDKAPVAATMIPPNPVELDSNQLYEIHTSPSISPP